jgi:hypothetical protein
MKGKIILFLMVVISVTTTSLVGAVKISENMNTNIIQTNMTNNLDIALVQFSPDYCVRILFSDENGDYSSCQKFSAGGDPEKVIAGDFNSNIDTLDDLAVINRATGNLSILLQKPDGGFDLQDDQYYTGVGPNNLASGYFNSDDYVDIAVINQGTDSNSKYYLNIFLGNGNGGFTEQDSSPYSFDHRPGDLTIGDFNNDNASDIAVVNELGNTAEIQIFLNKNTGEGDFELNSKIFVNEKLWRITAGDFNNDDFCDLATTNSSGGQTISGSICVFLCDPQDPDFFNDYIKCSLSASTPNDLTTGDFNKDGYLDIAVANGAYSSFFNSISVLLNNGGTGFNSYRTYGAGYDDVCNIFPGDIDNDGYTDLVVCAISGTTGGVSILYGKSGGGFTTASLDIYEAPYWGIALGEFGEFNNNNPSVPTISGNKNGATGVKYEYTFSSSDPEDDDVKFEINWGDEIEDTDYCSGTKKVSHSWNEKGEYAITARAIDFNGGVSDWASYEISMPKPRHFLFENWIHIMINRFFSRLLI